MTQKKNDIARLTEQEIATMRTMIALYCHGNHGSAKDELCPECAELFAYTLERIEQCPMKETKDFCSNCTVHCYQPERREQIRTVMRYSGPRMLFHSPIMALRHLTSTFKRRRG